ncbi:MAG TPA: DUF1203 domain-containing protein [Caulobacterales bacterium]|nr:DUF1203 domain-containing protein [Caulobacterales bacterium]
MSFRIRGLDPAPFQSLFQADAETLRGARMERVRVEEKPGAPCRITLADAEVGEEVLLLSYTHQPAPTPYAQQGPIFVRAAIEAFDAVDVVPPAFLPRMMSLRAFDALDMMLDADLVQGADSPALIARLFANPDVAYIHAHYARRGCFAARIDRA